MTRNQAKKRPYVIVALCLGLLLAAKLGSDSQDRSRLYYRQHVEDIKLIGQFSDNKANRRFLVKAFGQALRDNQTAKYIAIVWDFTDGPYQGRKEVGLDRKDGVVWVYFYIGANRDAKHANGCGIGSEIAVQSMVSLILNNKQIWPAITSTSMWSGECVPGH